MSPFISILTFQTSSCSGENIVGGLLGISGDKVWFKTSDFKLDIASMICGKPYKTMLSQIISLIKNHIDAPTNEFPRVFSEDYISSLNRYSQGVLQFGQPKPLGLPLDNQTFEVLFKQFVGEKPLETAE